MSRIRVRALKPFMHNGKLIRAGRVVHLRVSQIATDVDQLVREGWFVLEARKPKAKRKEAPEP